MSQAARRDSEGATIARAATAARRPHRLRTWSVGLVVVLAVLLIAIRLALPHLVRNYVNRTLSMIPDYRGEVGDIDIHLWRGAYTIHDAKVVRTSGKVPVPFFSAPRVDLSVQWRELFHRAL